MQAIIDTATTAAYFWRSNPVFNLFLILPQKDVYRWAFFALFILFALFLTIGFRTRLSAIIVYLGLLSLDRQAPLILDGGDEFMRIMSFLLIFSAAGEAYSVDRFLQAKKQGCRISQLAPVVVAPWAQRMIQVQISLTYLHAFLAKIVGLQWQDGTAVYYASQLADFSKFPLPWLTTNSPIYQFLTYYTLFAEFGMAILIWIKPWRYWILLAAALLHAGIDWTMNLPCFEWLFICSYLNFIEPKDLQKFLHLCQQKLSQWLPVVASRNEQSQQIVPIIRSQFAFLPLFSTLVVILLAGDLAGSFWREHCITIENKRNYQRRLYKAERMWSNKWTQFDQAPDYNEDKLNAEEALGSILSLKNQYAESGKLLRDVCEKRIEQKKAYNAELIRAFSSLSNIYLETGHLDAGELCYQTILDYDKKHLPFAQPRLSVDLNNLGVLYYFRALLDTNKSSQLSNFTQSTTYFRQALNKSHLSQSQSLRAFQLNESDILSNQYLCLREQGHLNEAKAVKDKATKLNSKQKSINLPQ